MEKWAQKRVGKQLSKGDRGLKCFRWSTVLAQESGEAELHQEGGEVAEHRMTLQLYHPRKHIQGAERDGEVWLKVAGG